MVQERHNKIMEYIRKDGVVKVSALMNEFGVSIETVRRDLESMERMGLLSRVYGGAVAILPRATEPSYSVREIKHFLEKKAIGAKAVDCVKDEEVIAIDIGTTTLEFAKALVGKKKITAITNSMKIAMVLADDVNIRVIMVGGEVRSGEYSVSGYLSEHGMNYFATDKYFLGPGGISLTQGITDYHMEESNLRRSVIENTQKVIALADYSKFGVIAMNKICGLNRIDTIVTDTNTDIHEIERLKKMNIEVIQAGI